MFCSLVYAGNHIKERRLLWTDLGIHKHVTRGCPWVLLGDFNVALNLEDTYSGSSSLNSAMIEFKDCVADIEVMDINCSGLHFTWNQKPKGGGGILKKLDRIMGNVEFIDEFPGAHAFFQPYRISDHSPAVLKIPDLPSNKPKPFKFFNFITHKKKFLEVVAAHWNSNVHGHSMFQVTTKLKALKRPLRKLVHDQGNLHDRVNKLRHELDVVQKSLDLRPDDQILREEEAVYVQAFNEAKLDEEHFLKQKAKIEWLNVGDSNSAYFHKSLKSRIQRSQIEVVLRTDNIELSGPNVPDAFVHHYEMFLGTQMTCDELNCDGLFTKVISDQSCSNMVRNITDEEIKKAMFSIGDDRAPGPDGFTSAFFKKGWDIVGHDVCKVIRDFFVNGQLLKELNHTFIALIPKVSTPHRINDYRPISCCNVIYKCISKILTNCIIEGIKEIVSDNQSAFVPGRRISDNILLTQELMHNYHRNRGPPRCAFKVDIQKAYDTVDWNFLETILKRFGFHTGFWSLNEFKNVSGLVPSIPKSTVYFCNVVNHVKLAILSIMPFSEGTLPVTYLGVPLISTRLFNRDCKVISSMHVYWPSVLMIPIGILLDIEQLIRGFLWCNGELKRGKAKVAWADICLPKSKGGLGLRRLEIFNIALMTTHIWNIVSNKESLWVRGIHTYKLKGRSLWEIGSGRDVSIWFDWWSDECPLIRYLSPRDISREGFTLQDTIADMVSNEGWRWPQAWLLKAPILGLITTPVLEVNKLDTCWWRDDNGHMSKFSVKAAWEAFRPRGNEVTWHRIVWFSNNIPRHAFHLWLVMRKSLKTHDKLRQWDVGGDLNLSMDIVPARLEDIVYFL
ncbi:hypothetical protein Tco_1300537 [Tanacetum coccineum]